MKNLNSFTLEYIYDEIDVFSLFKFDQIKIRSSLKIKLYTYICNIMHILDIDAFYNKSDL